MNAHVARVQECRAAWALVLMLAAISRSAVAMPLDLASVRGQIIGPAGSPVGGATVVLRCTGSPPVARTAFAGADGHFQLEGLPGGRCAGVASAKQYENAELPAFDLRPGQEHQLTVLLAPRERTAPRRAVQEVGLGRGLPLPPRRLEAVMQLGGALDGDRGQGGGVRGGRHYGAVHAIDGFEVTDPQAPGLAQTVPHAGVVAMQVEPAAHERTACFGSGALIDLHTISGSNRWDAVAEVSAFSVVAGAGQPASSQLGGWLAGPVVKDHAWFSIAGELRRPLADGSAALSPAAVGKMTVRAGARHTLTALAVGGGQGQSELRREHQLLGATWEALPTDTIAVRLKAGVREGRQGGAQFVGREAALLLEWFPRFARTDHTFTLSARAGDLRLEHPAQVGAGPAGLLTDELRRSLAVLQHRWRPIRALTIATGASAGVGFFRRSADADDRLASGRARPAPRASLAWDATGDGRTAVRASVGEVLDLGSLPAGAAALAEAATLAGASGWELAAGAEREIYSNAVLALDLGARWRPHRLPGDDRGARYHLAAAQARLPLGTLRLRAHVLLERVDGTTSPRARLSGTWALLHGVHAGFLLAHDDRRIWTQVATDAAPSPPAPAPHGPIAAARIRLDLGLLTGVPLLLSADAFTRPAAVQLTLATSL